MTSHCRKEQAVGHIRLDRDILDWEWYTDANTRSLFIHCLLKANYKDCNFKGQRIKRGSFVTSYATLERELGMSVNKIRTALEHLKSTGSVTVKSQAKYSIITVKNYNRYQADNTVNHKQTTDKPQADHTKTTGKSQTDHREITTREIKEEGNNINKKECKRKRKLGEFSNVLLTEKEIITLTEELGSEKYNAVIKKLDEYIEQTGKEYKNHLLVIRKWVIRAVEEDEAAGSNRDRNSNTNSGRSNQFNSFEQRQYDYGELEKQLLENRQEAVR